jgi:hypothetical protein
MIVFSPTFTHELHPAVHDFQLRLRSSRLFLIWKVQLRLNLMHLLWWWGYSPAASSFLPRFLDLAAPASAKLAEFRSLTQGGCALEILLPGLLDWWIDLEGQLYWGTSNYLLLLDYRWNWWVNQYTYRLWFMLVLLLIRCSTLVEATSSLGLLIPFIDLFGLGWRRGLDYADHLLSLLLNSTTWLI